MSNDESSNEEEFQGEKTPYTHAVKMAEREYAVIRMIVAAKGWLMRDFYKHAYRQFVEKREKFHEEGRDEEFRKSEYTPAPNKGKYVSIAIFERHIQKLEEWADEDNVRLMDAAYTAIYEAIQELKSEIQI
jgi:hypothetical protein